MILTYFRLRKACLNYIFRRFKDVTETDEWAQQPFKTRTEIEEMYNSTLSASAIPDIAHQYLVRLGFLAMCDELMAIAGDYIIYPQQISVRISREIHHARRVAVWH